MNNIRVVIADDQQLIREGIWILLESQGIAVIACAESGKEAIKLAAELKPDVVLMDIKMQDMSGLEALKEIKRHNPKTRVLMLTTFDPDEYILEAFRNGADGYLLKDLSGDRLSAAVRDAYAGNVTIPAAIAARLIAQIPKDTQRKTIEDYGLTRREEQIAKLIVKGYRNECIAEELGIKLGTVKNYISTLYSKLEACGRCEAIYILQGLASAKENRGQG